MLDDHPTDGGDCHLAAQFEATDITFYMKAYIYQKICYRITILIASFFQGTKEEGGNRLGDPWKDD